MCRRCIAPAIVANIELQETATTVVVQRAPVFTSTARCSFSAYRLEPAYVVMNRCRSAEPDAAWHVTRDRINARCPTERSRNSRRISPDAVQADDVIYIQESLF